MIPIYKLGDDYMSDIKVLRSLRNKLVFTNGCFDILHAGHVHYLNACKKHGDVLVIGLNTDASIKKIKGKNRPIQHQEDRAVILNALACVDMVVMFDEETPQALIANIVPDVLIKGGDYAIDNIVGREIVEANGGLVTTVPLLEGRSSTGIVDRIRGSNL